MLINKVEQVKSSGGIKTATNDVPDDLYLVCASYEPRSVAATESLSLDYKARKGIIYINKEFYSGASSESIRSNIIRLQTILEQRCDSVELAIGSWLDVKSQLEVLKSTLLPAKPEQSKEWTSTIDITSFNREVLLTSVALLRVGVIRSRIKVIYVSPHSHGQWLSRGFRGIRNVMGLSGIQSPSKQSLLVVLSGFEPDRTIRIIEEHEPRLVLLGLGDPPTNQEFLLRNREEMKLVLARQDVKEFEFPTASIQECLDVLQKLLKNYLQDYNIILAPMSTKLSTIAAFLVAECHPEVQITYALPGEYNTKDYSTGADNVYEDWLPELITR